MDPGHIPGRLACRGFAGFIVQSFELAGAWNKRKNNMDWQSRTVASSANVQQQHLFDGGCWRLQAGFRDRLTFQSGRLTEY